MPGPLHNALWLFSFLLQGAVVVCALAQKSRRRYALLILYVFANFLVNILQFYVLRSSGYESDAYLYFYYFSEVSLVVILFFAITTLYRHAFAELSVSRYVSGGAILLLAATALFSYATIQLNAGKLRTPFVVELSQNLYFVGVVLVYLLWGVMMQLRETRVRLLQFTFSLGINFSLLAAAFALRNLFPLALAQHLQWVPQFASVFLAASWLYAFTFVSEERRLATASISASVEARVALREDRQRLAGRLAGLSK